MTRHTSSVSMVLVVKIVLLTLLSFIVVGVLLGVMVGFYVTTRVQRDPNQPKFQAGTLPSPAPDGVYKGDPRAGIGKSWQGKVFDAGQQAGINQFSDGQRYRFKTYQAEGLKDPIQVLRIDYNQSGNPLWLRYIVDEIVQVGPDRYLGKVHVKLLGITFSITYFELAKKP